MFVFVALILERELAMPKNIDLCYCYRKYLVGEAGADLAPGNLAHVITSIPI